MLKLKQPALLSLRTLGMTTRPCRHRVETCQFMARGKIDALNAIIFAGRSHHPPAPGGKSWRQMHCVQLCMGL